MDLGEVEEIEEAKEEKKEENKEKKKVLMQKNEESCNSNDSLNWLVHQFFVRNEFNECIEVLSKYSKNSNEFESAYSFFIKGLIKRRNGHITESQILLKKCLNINERSSIVIKELGKNFLLLGKYKMAIDAYKILLDKNEEDWDSLYHIGLCYMNSKNYTEAKSNFEKAYEIKKSEDIFLMLGRLLVLEKNYSAAIENYEQVLSVYSDNAELMTAIGALYSKQRNEERACEYFQKALIIDQKYSNSLLGLASIYQYQGNYEDAYVQYKMSTLTNPNSPLIWNNLGLCFFSKNKLITATSCLKKAMYFDPFQWSIAFNLGLVYLVSKQYTSAFIYMNAAANLKNNYPLIFMYLGIILSELNDISNAINYYERAITLKPSAIIYFNYTISLAKNEMFGNAKEQFKKFRELFQKEKEEYSEENTMMEEMIPTIKKILK